MMNLWLLILKTIRMTGASFVLLLSLTLGSLVGAGCGPCSKKAEDETIEGVDKNQDGVRDDVEALIEREYAGDRMVQMAMRQQAKALQNALKNDLDAEVVAGQITRASLCFAKVDLEAYAGEAGEVIEDLVVNTRARARRYIEFNGKLSGKMLGGHDPKVDPCEFEHK